jgi:hypothetical protein
MIDKICYFLEIKLKTPDAVVLKNEKKIYIK